MQKSEGSHWAAAQRHSKKEAVQLIQPRLQFALGRT